MTRDQRFWRLLTLLEDYYTTGERTAAEVPAVRFRAPIPRALVSAAGAAPTSAHSSPGAAAPAPASAAGAAPRAVDREHAAPTGTASGAGRGADRGARRVVPPGTRRTAGKRGCFGARDRDRVHRGGHRCPGRRDRCHRARGCGCVPSGVSAGRRSQPSTRYRTTGGRGGSGRQPRRRRPRGSAVPGLRPVCRTHPHGTGRRGGAAAAAGDR